ncbi:hypothetical protein B0A52_04926 [Exophiala mesophila]|uniref:AB hydrolase-1 domain-containing protein n=1 Tax=Exophiala mesophila TaxID=212818 RepID=A0A438N6U4_EXOME|nr:hypothetical protein B0A52_04926 [Exophiala mesophila]
MAQPVSGSVPLPSTPSVSIYYVVNGPLDGSKPIIALSNSLAASTSLWDEFVSEIQSQFSVIRYDARFHGNSPLSTDPEYDYSKLTMDDLAEDLLVVIDHLKVDKLHGLIGLSIGAGVALVFGSKWPNRVDHVVVVGTKAATDDTVNATFDQRIALAKEHGVPYLAGQSISRWFPQEWIDTHAREATALLSIVARQPVEAYTASVAALKGLDLFPTVEKIGAAGDGGRFVFVAGENDGTIPQESEKLASIAQSKFIMVPDTGHIVHIESPERFGEIVSSVLSISAKNNGA